MRANLPDLLVTAPVPTNLARQSLGIDETVLSNINEVRLATFN